MPTISIGLPVYNGENYIREAIDSVLGQSYRDFELVICDNHSSDATQEICEDYAARDPRVRYFRNEKNLGAAPNYNRTFELSSGTFFKWLGHDDVLADGYLEKCLAPLLEHADVVMAFPGLTYIDGEGAVIRHQNRPDFGMMAELPGERTRQFIDHQKAGDDVFWSVFGLIRREALGKTHLIASYNASDQVLLMELLLQGKFYQVPEHLYLRREHHNASMTRHKSEAERLKWFDTSLRKKLIFTHWNLLFKHFKAIREFKPRDSLTCYLQICRRFFLREWRTMGGEIKLIAKQLIGIGRA